MEIYPKKPIKIASKQELDKEMRRIQQLFSKSESEDTWEAFALALKNIGNWATQDKANEYPGFVDHFKLLQQSIIKTLMTERTKLSGTATDLLTTLSQVMERDYEPIHDLFGPTLIRMFARTNKVMYTRALDCYRSIIINAKIPKLIPKLCNVLKKKEPSKSVRQCVASCLEQLLRVNQQEDIEPHIPSIQVVLRMHAMDPAPEVRLAIRNCYQAYCTRFPDHASRFEVQLPQDVKKYLNVTTKPVTTRPIAKRPVTTKPVKRLSSSSIPKLPATTKPVRARYSAPQPATSKLPAPRFSASASLATKKTKPTLASVKPASVLKPMSASKPGPVPKPAPGLSSKPAPVLSSNSDPFSLLMRPTASSAQKSKTSLRQPFKKTFTLQGMIPSRPVKRPSTGIENSRPTKKPTIERATQ